MNGHRAGRFEIPPGLFYLVLRWYERFKNDTGVCQKAVHEKSNGPTILKVLMNKQTQLLEKDSE